MHRRCSGRYSDGRMVKGGCDDRQSRKTGRHQEKRLSASHKLTKRRDKVLPIKNFADEMPAIIYSLESWTRL